LGIIVVLLLIAVALLIVIRQKRKCALPYAPVAERPTDISATEQTVGPFDGKAWKTHEASLEFQKQLDSGCYERHVGPFSGDESNSLDELL